MMEYTSKYWNMLTPLIKKSLLKRYGKEETAELLRKTNQIYRDMLRRADDIGKDNPMASNLYEGLIFLALWDASDRQISVDELRTISEEMMAFPLLKAMGLMINANKKSGMARIAKMMHKDAAWLEAHPQYKAYSWIFILMRRSIRTVFITTSPNVPEHLRPKRGLSGSAADYVRH